MAQDDLLQAELASQEAEAGLPNVRGSPFCINPV